MRFGIDFGFPKITKIGPKSDVKQSLFRDAMEITPESSKINGGHSFWITNMATHMIRSSLYFDSIGIVFEHIQMHLNASEQVRARSNG